MMQSTSPTWLERLMIRDRAAAREQIGRMIAWKPERILLAHGKCIEHDGEAVLRKAYAWLNTPPPGFLA